MDQYERRQHEKTFREKYRDAAQRLYPTATVKSFANVQMSLDDDGAFVECVVWIPKTEVE